MRAVVTGGLGFIGSHLVDLLDCDVTVIDDGRTSKGMYSWPHAEVIRAAVQDLSLTADIVFHLASPVGPVGVLGEAGRITPQIIEDCHWVTSWADRIVFVSTSEVYGGGENCSETSPRVVVAGHSARLEYQTAKLAAETMLLNMDRDVRIIRPFNVAGPRQSSRGGFVLPRFITQALRGEPLSVYQPGTQRRAFTHVQDISEGILAVSQKGEAGQVYNLGNPANTCSISQLADEVIDAVGYGTRTLIDPVSLWGPEFREAPDKLPDPTKAEAELGWRPTRGRAQVIEDAVRFMRQPGALELYA